MSSNNFGEWHVAQAGSWAVAANLARELGPDYMVDEWFPYGDYNGLRLRPRVQQEDRPRVFLNRTHGSIWVGHPVSDHPMEQPGIWASVGTGEDSARVIANRIADRAGAVGQHMRQEPAVAFLAEVARLVALFRLDWEIHAGWVDREWEPDYRRELYGRFTQTLPVPREGAEGSDGVWFVLAGGNPLLALDSEGGVVHLPAGDSLPLSGIAPTAAEAVSTLLGKSLQSAVHQNPPQQPGLGLPTVLSQFNRKERFFLLAHATGQDSTELHGESLTLSEDFRRDLPKAAGLPHPAPAHAWASFDYHLDWLHGALCWAAGLTFPGQPADFPIRFTDDSVQLVRGSQEDIDLIVCWVEGDGVARVILLEAKGDAAWSNSQAESKMRRLGGIIDAARFTGLGLDVRLVLSSPRAPQKLATVDWPPWALDSDGKPRFMPMPFPRMRLNTQRCDQRGRPAAGGDHWRVTGP